jgi:hypothetical protein
MVRWLESQGYDATYITDVDQAANPNVLSARRLWVNAGHADYYSDGQRASVTNGIAAGTNIALMGGANFFQRVKLAADAHGTPNRRVHYDRGTLNGLDTVAWRDLSPAQPENAIAGVMVNGAAASRPFLVADGSSWVFAGTGLSTYTGNGANNVVLSGPGQNAIDGLIGYEFDSRATGAPVLGAWAQYEPAGIHELGHSFVPAADNGVNDWADTTMYTAPSGATIFAAGTPQWSQGLMNPWNTGFCNCGHRFENEMSRRITHNIVDHLSE